MTQRGTASVSRAAFVVLTTVLLLLLDVASARLSRRGLGNAVKQGHLLPEESFVKDNWMIKREFFFKRDQNKSGSDYLTVRENKLARFNKSGEVGYWKLERRPVPGAPKRKIPLSNEGMDVLVLDVPEQGERKNLIVSYEIPVTHGRYHPTSVMFAERGSIYVARSKEELVGAAAASRKKIGSFSVDLPTLPPMVDRTFTL